MRSQQTDKFKAQINKFAKNHDIPSQLVLQNYFSERLAARIAASKYRNHFVFKGGLLLSNLFGLPNRTTYDIDITFKQLPLSEEVLTTVLSDICKIDLNDDLKINIESIKPIRKDDCYGGLRVKVKLCGEILSTILSLDITTGDIITPKETSYSYSCLFAEDSFTILGYPLTTILAEKVEAILSKSTTTTRPKDFYDIYLITTKAEIDKSIFKNALNATCKHRNSENVIIESERIINELETSDIMEKLWDGYKKTYSYAKDITYQQTIQALRDLLS